ncbi:MAG: UDP-N-acetylmuramoyl-L-alanyl-D-glutamate--2,6-diaminopimelate ligase [Christensenellales bacterium]|jgi:UDP-N-acetylmuramoyl-L-alanyl-D-glutamate--2,6-diaminopimelate ligase
MLLSGLVKDLFAFEGQDADITSVEYDSRNVKAGSLFFCIKGFNSDGHDYAAAAVDKGAAALVVTRRLSLNVPQVVVNDDREAMALISARFYGYPAREMKIIGITGTNGKTSTTYIIKSIAEESGMKAGVIGTIANMIGGESIPSEHTTPEAPDMQRLLRRMADEGVAVVAMEVSSHSLELKRVSGIEFDAAVFTNLTQDHLDFHKNIENYSSAKAKLFSMCKAAVINIDDAASAYMSEAARGRPVITYGMKDADVEASKLVSRVDGVTFTLKTPDGVSEIDFGIPGIFSIYNAMAAGAACLAVGFTHEQTVTGLNAATPVNGRCEVLDTGGEDFTVILDYAHSPDGLENILKTVRGFASDRVVTVFGCGGDRDKTKRPIMGEIAGRLSEFAVVTSDNPRTERPMDIIEAVVRGIKDTGCEYIVVENRREAIKYALYNARPKDVIVLAGKGHETYQEIQGRKYPFDEKVVVAELLAEKDGRDST